MGFAARWTRTESAVDEMMEAAHASMHRSVIDLALGDPDLDTDPRVIDAALRDAQAGFTHYAPARGDADLLEAIRRTWNTDLGVDVSERQLMVTASGCHAMWLLLSAIIDPDDEVIVFAPYFSPYPSQIGLAGGVPVVVDTTSSNGFIPQPADFEQSITARTKAVIVNSPNNPTGAVLSASHIAALLDICVKHDLLYIADDIYTAYAFEHPFVAVASFPHAREHVATIRSFSKDFCMSGWRLGYVVAPDDVITAMLSVNENNVYVAPTISQRAALHALDLRKEITDKVHDTYRERMTYVAARISRIPYLVLPSAEGSLYAFIDISGSGESSASFTQKALERHRVSLIPGTAFGEAGEGFVRMALRQDIETLATVFDRLDNDGEWITRENR